MKNLIYFLLTTFLISCNENKESVIEKKIVGDKVSKNTTKEMPGKPPLDNPIMVELFNSSKNDLNKVDKIYKENISKSKSKDYYENLKQYGLSLVIKHGLIENGTSEQKKFYIQEQVNSLSNLPHIDNFYSLIKSKNLSISKQELSKLELTFFNKNINYINTLDWSLDQDGKKKK